MLIEQIPYKDPFSYFIPFANSNGSIFLDSSKQSEKLGRYSFIAVDPFKIIESKNNSTKIDGKEIETKNCFDIINKEINKYKLETIPNFPPFQTGAAGLFSYDLRHNLEKLPKTEIDELNVPDLYLGFYDLVIAFDHLKQECFAISSGFPEQQKNKRTERAAKRLNWLLTTINNSKNKIDKSNIFINESEIKSNFSREQYINIVQKTIDYILDGDIFEANITQRFLAKKPKELSCLELYERIRNINPAPFSAFINAGESKILSSSPERFLQLNNKTVETRPIKGTAKRELKDKELDKKISQQLYNSEKDRAENIMIVDLMRNDISKVCQDGSIKVPQLCEVESYETVHHLVSVVEGTLKENKNAIDLLKATFPGGSITGAPKIRAMEIIGELEGIARGPYCGSIGYIGFNGDMDTSIVIRTYNIKNDIINFNAGGAIVADSNSEQEYIESLDKAYALKQALTANTDLK